MIEILQAETAKEIAEARKLFREYEAWLGLDLCFQGFEEELAHLPGKYAKPEGRLLLALADKKAAGYIAFRKIEEGVCEMKRLFVRPEFRTLGLGRKLIGKLLEEAKIAGYRRMRLDTYPPKMGTAVRLYESKGFREIPAYYHNPYSETLFMELVFERFL